MAGAFFGILCALSGSAELLGIIVGLEAWPGLSFKQKPHNRNLFAEGFVENQFSERHDGFVMVSAGDAESSLCPCVLERCLTRCSVPVSSLVSNQNLLV